MKFARNAYIARGHLDAAPFFSVLLLLVIFLMAGGLVYTPGVRREGVVYTPGVRLQVPAADDLAGTDKASVSVALDKNGRLYFENQGIEEPELRSRLSEIARSSKQPLTLLVHADKDATYEMIVHLGVLARDAGMTESFLATLPRPVTGSARPNTP
jgi:biopolymer transport protein ExbD